MGKDSLGSIVMVLPFYPQSIWNPLNKTLLRSKVTYLTLITVIDLNGWYDVGEGLLKTVFWSTIGMLVQVCMLIKIILHPFYFTDRNKFKQNHYRRLIYPCVFWKMTTAFEYKIQEGNPWGIVFHLKLFENNFWV